MDFYLGVYMVLVFHWVDFTDSLANSLHGNDVNEQWVGYWYGTGGGFDFFGGLFGQDFLFR